MTAVLLVLLLLSAVGAVDTVYFHIWKLRLYRQSSARWEVLTHAGHGVAAASIFALTAVEATGGWAWLYITAGTFQVINQTVDTVLEPASRRPLGGVPDGEYVMHGIINFLWGAVLALLLAHAFGQTSLPPGLSWRLPDLPLGLWLAPPVGCVGSLGFAFFDFMGFITLSLAVHGRGREQVQS